MKGGKKEATMKAMARKEEVIRKKRKRNVHAALCACVLKINVRELSDQN